MRSSDWSSDVCSSDLPKAVGADREADGGRNLPGGIVAEQFLRIGAAHPLKVEAAFVRQVGVGGGGRVLGGRGLALRPILEQVGQQAADAVFLAAIFDAAAFDHAGILGGAIDLLLPASGAGDRKSTRLDSSH